MVWRRVGLLQDDRRQIQTAVLGKAESEEPLVLPLEAIELDAFRRLHVHDTFWCGLLLGGCGGQLTTKLYTDRACHFAHHPDPDGLPHECRRHARGVASADHLYVKSAAADWLRGRSEDARFTFAQPGGARIGSIVDIHFKERGLRVHLDPSTAPEWDDDHEPVLGLSVPVDRDTLIRRWYVHRIRLDSQGTARTVRIGTEAFARPTEWFALDECAITERGLSTPAVERIVEGHQAPTTAVWSPGKARKLPAPDARAQALLRRLLYARRVNSVPMAKEACGEIAQLPGVSPDLQDQLAAAVRGAQGWLEDQMAARRALFARLDSAVGAHRAGRVRRLLAQVDATAAHGRTEAEAAIVARATVYYDSLDASTRATVKAEAATESAALDAARRVRTYLRYLAALDAYTREVQRQVTELLSWAALAGTLLSADQAAEVAIWTERADRGPEPTPHSHVARRYWYQRECPRCHAFQGSECLLTAGTKIGQVRSIPHPERLQRLVEARKERQQAAARPWGVYEVTCPDCARGRNARCESPAGPHRSRVELAEEYTRAKRPKPQA